MSSFFGKNGEFSNCFFEAFDDSIAGDSSMFFGANVGNGKMQAVKESVDCSSDSKQKTPYEYDAEVSGAKTLKKIEQTADYYEKNCILKEFAGNDLVIYKDVVTILNRLNFTSSFEVTVLAKLLTMGVIHNNVNYVRSDFFKQEAESCMFNANALEMRVRRAFSSAKSKGNFEETFRRIFNMNLNVLLLSLSNFSSSFILGYSLSYKNSSKTFFSIAKDF